MAVVVEPGRYVLAVSGGVDSVVLLDMLAGQPGLELVVAHFDHGIRPDSHEDAALVAKLAGHYDLPFEVRRENLGTHASEALARERRYKFLREVAATYDAQIITAHHGDDVAETIAINLTRGTGWRGLAVLDSDIVRPLLGYTKTELRAYAKAQKLSWHEDSTNLSGIYLRNRLRRKMSGLKEPAKRELLALRAAQVGLKREIEAEARRLLTLAKTTDGYRRYLFTHSEPVVAMELLNMLTRGKLTRPQLGRLLLAIKTLANGKSYEAGAGIVLDFTSRHFTLRMLD